MMSPNLPPIMGRGMPQMPMQTNPMATIMQMMQMASGNPQQAVAQIMSGNPDFAKAIQGQNPQQLAMQLMRQRGLDPNTIGQMFKR